MSIVNSRHRPALVAFSVLLGVVLAAGGFVVLRALPNDDESLRITVPDTHYRPAAAPFLSGAAPEAPPAGGGLPTSTTASPEPSTPASPSSTETPKPPSPTSSPKSSAPVAAADASITGQVLALVNQKRADAGCGALTMDPRLATAAQEHSQDMSVRRYFSHTTPEGETFDQRIEEAGYPDPAAENIARGSTTAAQTMDLWMNSDGHRRNILNCSFKKLGVGVAKAGWYWTQNFGY